MLALTVANIKMMARNRHTTLWSLIFPLMLVVVFGLFTNFGGSNPSLVIIDQASTPRSQELAKQLTNISFLKLDPDLQIDDIQSHIKSGTLDYLLVIPESFGAGGLTPPTLTYSSNKPERNQLVAGQFLMSSFRVTLQIPKPLVLR